MPSALLTREELEALIDGVVREARAPLELKATGAFQREHDEFARRLAQRVNSALDAAGYAWARRPHDGDALYLLLVNAIHNAGFANRVGLASGDEDISALSRHVIVNCMFEAFHASGTAIVRRRPPEKKSPLTRTG